MFGDKWVERSKKGVMLNCSEQEKEEIGNGENVQWMSQETMNFLVVF